MKEYLVFDGRYKFDPDRASVIEVIGEMDNEENAIKCFRQDWEDTDCVLVSYDADGNTLINPVIIDSIY